MSLLKRIGSDTQAPTAAATMAPPAPVAGPPAAAPAAAAPPAGTPLGSILTQPAAPTAAAGPAPTTAEQDKMLDLSLQITDRILASLGSATKLEHTPESEQVLTNAFANFYRQTGATLANDQVKLLYKMVLSEIFGFGPIDGLLNDESVTEVMVNGPNMIYCERKGNVVLSEARFRDNDHVMKIIDRIIRPLGRRVDRKMPYVDARLPDGSRVNAIIPPCAIDGPTITIRKFTKSKLQVSDLIRFGSMTQEMADFLYACVRSHLNIVVSGGTGSGKTTLLNVLSNNIPEKERVITIEDSAELKLAQEHVVRLEAKPAEIDGSGRVSIMDLVVNSLRMRPDRLVIGEVRDGSAFSMLQAMNTGHDGSLTTLHANTPRDAISRMETMCMMAGMDMPVDVIRAQIASAIHLIVQQTRLSDGSRKVSSITEVQGLESGTVVLQEIFRLEEKGKTPEGRIISELRPTGVRPKFTDKLEAAGFKLAPSVFGATAPGSRR